MGGIFEPDIRPTVLSSSRCAFRMQDVGQSDRRFISITSQLLIAAPLYVPLLQSDEKSTCVQELHPEIFWASAEGPPKQCQVQPLLTTGDRMVILPRLWR